MRSIAVEIDIYHVGAVLWRPVLMQIVSGIEAPDGNGGEATDKSSEW
jgi:hypothetical protein